MPIKPCQSNGKSGYRWGDAGKCYTYTRGNEESRKRARRLADEQRKAIESSRRDR